MNILHNSVNIEQLRKENFPVASFLIPPHLRQAIHVLYAFARSLDNIADSSTLTTEQKYQLIHEYEQELNAIAHHEKPQTTLFQALAHTLEQHQLPLTPLADLLHTLKGDIDFQQPHTFDDLLIYCQGSANTIGDIFLYLFQSYTPALKQQSDAICTALQLIDCWQDIVDDAKENRRYLPLADMNHYGVTAQDITEKRFTPAWQAFMQQQLQRTHTLLVKGMYLPLQISGRFGWELRVMVLAGFRLIHQMAAQQGNTFNHSPHLSKWDWLIVFSQSLCYRARIKKEENKTIDCS